MSLAVLGVMILAIVAGVLLVLGGLVGWIERVDARTTPAGGRGG